LSRTAQISWLALVAITAIGCGLEREVELELPSYVPQPAIEAYLVPGEPFRVLITRSAGFFDPLETQNQQFFENVLFDSARVSIRIGDEEVIELPEGIYFDPLSGQLHNYGADAAVPFNYLDSIFLDVEFPDGRVAQGATQLLPPVGFDSIVVEYPEDLVDRDTLARIFSYITDPDPATVNRFHRLLSYTPIDSSAEQDFVFSDEFSDQGSIPTGTSFEFAGGDTLYILNAHVDEDFERYLTSVQTAEQANGNPFAQPSSLLGNLSGSANPIGIFTTYAHVVDTIYVPEF